MIKKLLIGASALAMATTTAFAAPSVTASYTDVGELAIDETTARGTNFDDLNADRPNGDATTANTSKSRQNGLGFGGLPSSETANVSNSLPSQYQLEETGDKAAVSQQGDSNVATVEQEAFEGGGDQGWAVVQQDGDTNNATIQQADDNSGSAATVNQAYVQQNASDTNTGANTAIVNQHFQQGAVTGAPGTFSNLSGLEQGDNIAVIAQGADEDNQQSTNSTASIEQFGAGNEGFIRQARPSGGANNVANIDQIGYGNDTGIWQQTNSTSDVVQYGFRNETFITQLGAIGGATSNVYQQGITNFIAIAQTDTAGVANVTQFGRDNQAFVEQRLAASDAVANVEQDGENNYTDVLQEVLNAQAEVLQDGNNNVALVRQTGNTGAAAYVSTAGTGNFVTVSQ